MSRLAEIEALLGRYFDALYTSDAAALGEAMHPRAVYATADEKPPLIRTMAEYLPVVAARESPQARNEPRRDIIDSIRFAGDNSAFAEVRCAIGTRSFTDFLSLIRVDGQWRIIAKVFHFSEKD
jgi:hypothetical protein